MVPGHDQTSRRELAFAFLEDPLSMPTLTEYELFRKSPNVVSDAYAFLMLREKRLLSASARAQTPYVSAKKLLDAATLLIHVVESLTLDDYAMLATALRGDHDRLTLI